MKGQANWPALLMKSANPRPGPHITTLIGKISLLILYNNIKNNASPVLVLTEPAF